LREEHVWYGGDPANAGRGEIGAQHNQPNTQRESNVHVPTRQHRMTAVSVVSVNFAAARMTIRKPTE
jgi:hypothetical protein